MYLHPLSSRLAPFFAAGIVIAAPVLLAGTLTPPIGPVVATMKPLTDVEPRIAINATNTPGDVDSVFKITAPGSYYLPANITVPVLSNKSGIKILSSDVTIDLAGFTIQGYLGTLDGIRAAPGGTGNISIHGGTIRGVAGAAINMQVSNCRVEDVSAFQCLQGGIYLGDTAHVSSCIVNATNGPGIFAGDRSIATGCIVTGASTGISLGLSSVATGCAAQSNAGVGISVSCGSTASECSAKDNGADGISACGTTITNCTSSSNAGNGIYTGGSSTVSGCSVAGNQGDGISCFAACLISGNNCVGGFGNGIFASNDGNRIEGNSLASNSNGIRVDGAGNLIVKNSVRSSTFRYKLAAGNRYGPIIDFTGGSTPAVNGSSAPSTLTSTDPNANFAY